MKYLGGTILLIGCLYLCCTKPSNPNGTVSYSGYVYDSCSHRPLAGIPVSVWASTTSILGSSKFYEGNIAGGKTDQTGHFSITGSYSYTNASAPSFIIYLDGSDPYGHFQQKEYHTTQNTISGLTFPYIKYFNKLYFTNTSGLIDSLKVQSQKAYIAIEDERYGYSDTFGANPKSYMPHKLSDTFYTYIAGLQPYDVVRYQYVRNVGAKIVYYKDSIFLNCFDSVYVRLK